jgi:hypothetical protein
MGKLLRGLTPPQLVDEVLGAQRPVEAPADPTAGDRATDALKAAERALGRPESGR